MAKDEEKGNPMSDLKWLIIIILSVWFIGRFGGLGGIGGQTTNTKNVTSPKSSFATDQTNFQSAKSSENDNSRWKDMIRIGRGNASGEDGSNQEYITLQSDTRNKESIDITRWSLTNGKDRKFFLTGNDKQVKGVSDKVIIPKATLIFIPNGVNPQEDIVLEPGDRAIITTGTMPNGIPFEIKTSFKENMCSGYIESLKDYDFTPSLDTSCPSPQSEKEVASLDDDCYKFVKQMSACHTPELKDIVYRGREPLTGFVDNTGNLSQQCKNFLKKNYNYESCVANHLSDEDFFGKEWRIFLNHPRELWAKDREAITLYDKDGKVVNQLIYGY